MIYDSNSTQTKLWADAIINMKLCDTETMTLTLTEHKRKH